MSREAQYTKDNQHRIISIHNGQWRAQRYEGKSEWSNVGPATDHANAVAILNSREPVKKSA